MLMATHNAVGLKDISVSKVTLKGADGRLVIMINLNGAAFKHFLLCLAVLLSVGHGIFRLD